MIGGRAAAVVRTPSPPASGPARQPPRVSASNRRRRPPRPLAVLVDGGRARRQQHPHDKAPARKRHRRVAGHRQVVGQDRKRADRGWRVRWRRGTRSTRLAVGCRPRPRRLGGRGLRAGGRPGAPPPGDQPAASRARCARHERPFPRGPPPGGVPRSPAWPPASARGPWRRRAPPSPGRRRGAAVSRARAPLAPAPGRRPCRAPLARTATPRRSGTPCSTRPACRTPGSGPAAARWRRRDARTAPRSRRRDGPARR